MLLVNRLLNSVFDLLMRPLERVGVVTGLAVVSLFTAIAILVVVRITSDQRAIAAVKRQIHADLFEIRLFNDDLRAILRAELQLLRHNATYLRLSIVPMLWMLVPAALVIAQLQCFFAYSGVEIGEPIVITAQLKSGRQLAALEVPPAIRVETPAIWVPALNQIMWRIVPAAPGITSCGCGLQMTRTTRAFTCRTDLHAGHPRDSSRGCSPRSSIHRRRRCQTAPRSRRSASTIRRAISRSSAGRALDGVVCRPYPRVRILLEASLARRGLDGVVLHHTHQ